MGKIELKDKKEPRPRVRERVTLKDITPPPHLSHLASSTPTPPAQTEKEEEPESETSASKHKRKRTREKTRRNHTDQSLHYTHPYTQNPR